MFAPLLILMLVCLWKIKFNFSKTGFGDYLQKDKTESVKGLFILIVFLSHFNKYVSYSWTPDVYAFKIIGVIGQAMVIPFLVYSGFGVMESIKRKGISYVKGFPKNRILKVLLIFEFVNVFKILVKFILNGFVELEFIILSTITWLDWYVFAILLLYFFTYFAYLIFKDKKNYALLLISVIVLTVLYVTTLYLAGTPRFYYDTVLCYVIGLIWSIYKDKLDNFFAKNYVFYPVVIVLAAICAVSQIFLKEYKIAVIITYLVVAVLLLLITKKVQINNGVLSWCGRHLFDIYLVHRIPMDIFFALGINEISNYLYFGLSAVATFVLVLVLDLTINRWIKRLSKPKTIKE